MQSHIFVYKVFQGDTDNRGCSQKGNVTFCRFSFQRSCLSRNILHLVILSSESPVIRRSALYLTGYLFYLAESIYFSALFFCCYVKSFPALQA